MDFWRALQILNHRKWLILLSIIVTTVLTYEAAHLVGTSWQATVPLVTGADVAFETPSGNVKDQELGIKRAEMQAAFYTAELKSANVLVPVFHKLGIVPTADLVNNIEIKASSIHLYQLQVSDRNPDVAGKVANALAEYFEQTTASYGKSDAAKKMAEVQGELTQIDTKLTVATHNLDVYRVQHRIVGDYRKSVELAVGQLRDVTRQRADAVQQVAMAGARLSQEQSELRKTKPTAMVRMSSSSSPTVKQYQQDLLDTERKLTVARASYTDADPHVRNLVELQKRQQARLATEMKKPGPMVEQQNPDYSNLQQEVADSQQRLASANAQLASLNGQFNQAQAAVDAFRGVDTPLSQLENSVAYLSDTRKRLVATLTSLQMSAGGQTPPLQILSKVNDYNPPVNVSLGRTVKVVVLGAICALIASCALIIAFESLDRRLRTVTEAEGLLPQKRVLAAIPQPMDSVTSATIARATELYPLSLHAESYRFLAHQILTAHRRMRSLMVITTKAEQGSTSVVTNLGITLAHAGHRVIIVDANVRTPEVHHVFEVPNDYGFMDVLQNHDPNAFDKALTDTSVPNLRVITSGHSPGNPWELFRSQTLAAAAAKLKDLADYVLYDTPSAVMFTDAMNLLPVVDGAFLCVRALEQPTGAEKRLVEVLEQSNVPVIGTVLTDVPATLLEGYNNYRHYYAPADAPVPLPEGGAGSAAIATSIRTRIVDPGMKNGHEGDADDGSSIQS